MDGNFVHAVLDILNTVPISDLNSCLSSLRGILSRRLFFTTFHLTGLANVYLEQTVINGHLFVLTNIQEKKESRFLGSFNQIWCMGKKLKLFLHNSTDSTHAKQIRILVL